LPSNGCWTPSAKSPKSANCFAVLRVRKVLLVLQVRKVPLVHPVRPVRLVRKVLLVLQVRKVPLVHPVRWMKTAFGRSCAT
jgi:hypothetical protein